MASIGLCQKLEVLRLDGTEISNQGLRHLSGLRNLRVLGLARTQVNDTGLMHLQLMKNLEWLTLEGTVVSGEGLAYLSECGKLEDLILDGTEITSQGLAHLSSLRNLRVLALARTQVSDAGLQHLRGLNYLRWLSLGDTVLNGEGLVYLSDCRQLEFLNLDRTNVSSEQLSHLRSLHNLRTLGLGNTRVDDSGIEQLSELSKLQSLRLDFTALSDEGLADVGSLYSLRSLFLEGTHITDDGLVGLKGLENLRDLHIGQTKLTDRGLENLLGLDLRILGLYKTQVTNTGVKQLAGFANLTWLHLGSTQITDEGIGYLRELKTLRELRLHRANVTRNGLVHVKALPNLVILGLNSTKIDDGALEELKDLTSLKRLDIRGTGLTDAGYKQLQRALPDCEFPMNGNDGTQAMAMLQKQADLYKSRQEWGKARQTYRRLVSLHPKIGLLWTELIDIAQWEDKAKENSLDSSVTIYNEAVEALGEDRSDLAIEMVHCLSCLLADRPEEYERVCRIVANKYLNSDVPRTQFQVAKMLALREEPVVACPNELVSIARRAIKTDPAKQYFPTGSNAQFDTCGKSTTRRSRASKENAALIALAHAKSGDDDEARRWPETGSGRNSGQPTRSSLDPGSRLNRMSWRLYLRGIGKAARRTVSRNAGAGHRITVIRTPCSESPVKNTLQPFRVWPRQGDWRNQLKRRARIDVLGPVRASCGSFCKTNVD